MDPGRRPEIDTRTRTRRLVAVGVAVVALALVLFAVKACIDSREQRAFENYERDLASLVSESQQLTQSFFGRLEEPSGLTALDFEAEVKADRSAASALVDRARDLDPPGDLAAAHADLVLAFELRLEGLTRISEVIGLALSDEGRDEGVAQVAEDMESFVAADVLYREARAEMARVLPRECASCPAPPETEFVPGVSWLDERTVAEALRRVDD